MKFYTAFCTTTQGKIETYDMVHDSHLAAIQLGIMLGQKKDWDGEYWDARVIPHEFDDTKIMIRPVL